MAVKSEILKISGGKKSPSEWSVRIVSSKVTGGQSKRQAIVKEAFRKATYPKFVDRTTSTKMHNKVGFGAFLVSKRKKEPVIVKASSISKGMKEAQKKLKSLVRELADNLFHQYKITEIELTLGFSAKGEFIGLGAGSDVSIKVKICPIEK